jgi:hypothetical protein
MGQAAVLVVLAQCQCSIGANVGASVGTVLVQC